MAAQKVGISLLIRKSKRKCCYSVLGSLAIAVVLEVCVPQAAMSQEPTRRFTVTDDIELTQLHATDPAQPYDYPNVSFSPNEKFVLVLADRGRIDINRMESLIRVYRTADIVRELSRTDRADDVPPFWVVTRATFKYGPIITDVRWLPDSRGISFLARNSRGHKQLFLGNIQLKKIEALSPGDKEVNGFDVRSHTSFVYSVLSSEIRRKISEEKQAAMIPGTGRSLFELMFPETEVNRGYYDLSEVWAVVNGKRFRLVNALSKQPIAIHSPGQHALALSPDGCSIVTALTIDDVPAEWESLYPPRPSSGFLRIRAGHQNPHALRGSMDQSEYALIDLFTGKITFLTDAPIGSAAGWPGIVYAEWSADGTSALLSNTFLPPEQRGVASHENRPCFAVVELTRKNTACLDAEEPTTAERGRARDRIVAAHFLHGHNDVIVFQYSRHAGLPWSRAFVRGSNGWNIDKTSVKSGQNNGPEITVKENLNEPPRLFVVDKKANRSALIWDPNPQLKHIKLGEASVFAWQDKAGRDWVGGLYKPPDYVSGRKYALVIQAHAFSRNQFLPSGSYPTVFAAQELAATGIVVLQVENCPLRGTTGEATCQVAGYESAVERLVNEGIVDQNRIGISGFSRSCYYVAQTLTTSGLRFKAALIADGITVGYAQYLLLADTDRSSGAREYDTLIGAPPFGAGFAQWLANSPLFHMDRVSTPVAVLARDGPSMLGIWEPYAILRYLHKPVDLVVMNSPEHVFTNPRNRLFSQSMAVDWFRFWLEDYEDPNPQKAEQYLRWKALRSPSDRTTEDSDGLPKQR